MQINARTNPSPDTRTRPGLTSLVRTGRGMMTVQTEIVGEPALLVTIVDFRGRVLKSWSSEFSVDEGAPDAPEVIRKWHSDIETQVRTKLSRAATRRPQQNSTGEFGSHLFFAAMRAYGERDFSTARAVLQACELLLPDDERVRAALSRLNGSLSQPTYQVQSHSPFPVEPAASLTPQRRSL